jgi:hypothetical protein
MAYNPEVPLIATNVQYALRTDERNPSPYIWSPLADYLSGKVTYRMNSAMTLNLQVPNADGAYTKFFHPGMRLKIFAELSDVLGMPPIFDGFIPPGAGITLGAGPSNAGLEVFAVGYLGLLALETIRVGEYEDASGAPATYTHTGRELSDAIRNELDALKLYAVNYDRVLKPTSPVIPITEDEELSAGHCTRKQLIDHYMAFAVDEEPISGMPGEYFYWETFGGTGGLVPQFRFLKKPQTVAVAAQWGETGTDPVRILDWEADILTSQTIGKIDQTTHCVCRSSVDPSIWEEYESSSLSRRYGKFSKILDLPTTNRDTLLRRARTYVALHRQPVFAVAVAVRDPPGTYHVGEVVTLDNAQYGLSGDYTITEVEFTFSPATYNTKLTLASSSELLSEVLST